MNKPLAGMLRRKEYKDMPVLIAFKRNGTDFLSAWCPYCWQWHHYGIGEGHRGAHCVDQESPFHKTGYILIEGKGTVQVTENWYNGKYRYEDHQR